MNIDELTIGQLKEITSYIGVNNEQPITPSLNKMIGKEVIIRTYSAGVWFGTLTEKSGNEVILSNARRMWRWWTKESISLSSVSIHGINRDKSKIAQSVEEVWLEAIEIIPCKKNAIESIKGAGNAKAE